MSAVSPSTIAPRMASERGARSWLETLTPLFSPSEIEVFAHVLDFCQPLYAGERLSTGEPVAQHVQGMVSILASLRVDIDTLMAGALYAVPDYVVEYKEALQGILNPTVAHLIEGVARMGRIRTMRARGGAADRKAPTRR